MRDEILKKLIEKTAKVMKVDSSALSENTNIKNDINSVIGDIRDFDRDCIEYNKFDLLQGITKQQLEYLVSDYHSRDFTNYITSEVNICIDRWY